MKSWDCDAKPYLERMSFSVLIPARLASSRLPNKPLADINGVPMVVRVAQRALQSKAVRTVVAADSAAIMARCSAFGIQSVLTRVDHLSGSDRLAEACSLLGLADEDIVVNVQGDEPAIDPAAIDAVIQPLLDDPTLQMATARRAIADAKTISDPNVVKVICDSRGRALYFSRLPIPYIRDESDRAGNPACYWQHIGLYVYRRDFLLAYTRMPQTPLENLEKLEQLRALENGHDIAVVETNYEVIGVDVPEDLAEVSALLQRRAAKENE